VETVTDAAAASLFGAPVLTGVALVARVRRDLERDYPDGVPNGVNLAAVARAAVAGLEGARVKAYLPVLALRAAHEMLAETRHRSQGDNPTTTQTRRARPAAPASVVHAS
jgi:hypothetical protein